MIMVVATARTMDVIVIGFDRGFQLFAGHFAIADFRLFKQEVDDLVLVQRSAKLRRRERVLLDIFDEALAVGDWVLVHVGFALSKIDEEEAALTLTQIERLGGDVLSDEVDSFTTSRIE